MEKCDELCPVEHWKSNDTCVHPQLYKLISLPRFTCDPRPGHILPMLYATVSCVCVLSTNLPPPCAHNPWPPDGHKQKLYTKIFEAITLPGQQVYSITSEKCWKIFAIESKKDFVHQLNKGWSFSLFITSLLIRNLIWVMRQRFKYVLL